MLFYLHFGIFYLFSSFFTTLFQKGLTLNLHTFKLSSLINIFEDKIMTFQIADSELKMGLEKKNIYSIPSHGKDGADLVLVEALIKYLFSTDLFKFPGKIYIASYNTHTHTPSLS